VSDVNLGAAPVFLLVPVYIVEFIVEGGCCQGEGHYAEINNGFIEDVT